MRAGRRRTQSCWSRGQGKGRVAGWESKLERRLVVARRRMVAVAALAGSAEALGERWAVRVDRLLCELLPDTLDDWLRDARQQDGKRRAEVALLASLRGLVEVVRELALELPADALAVVAHLPQLAVDLLGEHRLGHVGLRPQD